MLVVGVGGHAQQFSGRGITGPIEHVLYPIQHGILYYPGMEVLPPFVAYQADSVDEERFRQLETSLRERISSIERTEPIPFRPLSGGDYDRSKQLLPGREVPGSRGFDLHVAAAPLG